MSQFVAVATTTEITDGEMTLLDVEDRLVILFRVGDDYFCIDDVCTHDGGTLSDGGHEGFEIECPRHGARFDIRSGRALCMPATQDTRTHEVQVDGDRILVKISE